MRSKILLVFIVIFFSVKPIETFAQVNVQDSLALVDYYDSTHGVSPWQFGQSWDLQSPVSTWLGVGVSNNRVVSIKLWGGGHGGHIPSSFGNLTALKRIEFLDYMLDATLPKSFENLVNLTSVYFHAVFNMLPFPTALTKVSNLTTIDMEDNYFTDSLPSSFGDMKNLVFLNLFQNSLTGPIPTSINRLDSLKGMDISYNKYTFKDIAPFVSDYIISGKTYNLGYAPQANIPIHRQEDKLAVSAGGNLSDDTFKWFKDSVLVATIIGDSTYTPSEPGKYYVEVTNSIATGLTLYADEFLVSYILPTATTTITQNITGTDTTYINDGLFKIAALKPVEGANALTGNVSTSVTIDPAVSTFNTQPYVQRHYDISPALNAGTAQAIVTLYFTQQDFDNYNSYVTSNNLSYPLLPAGGIDNGNVRITQFHGSFTASPNPGNYDNNNKVLITPHVAWNSANNWWVVTFYVNGFSGFFVSTGNLVLPLSLIEFKGEALENKVNLKWLTANEVHTKEFIIEHSLDGTAFNDIGVIAATSIVGKNDYNFKDLNPSKNNNFYRLRMIDTDGRFSYSPIIKINFQRIILRLNVYPNPATYTLNIKFTLNKAERIALEIMDASGKSVQKILVSGNTGTTIIPLSINNLPKGIYTLYARLNDNSEKISFVKK